MNLAFDYLNDVVSSANRRMDRVGMPKIVRERCPFCTGCGLREIGHGPLAKLLTCAACCGRGYITVESP